MTESDILYQTGSFWVKRARKGYEVYQDGVTYATRCAIIGHPGNVGLTKAILEADRRAGQSR